MENKKYMLAILLVLFIFSSCGQKYFSPEIVVIDFLRDLEQEGRESVYDYFVEDIRKELQEKDQAWEIPELISDSQKFRFEVWNYKVKDEQAVVEIKTTSNLNYS